MVHFGKDATLNNNTGTAGTPVWDPVAAVRNVQLNGDFDEIEASGRDTILKATEPGMLGLSIDFELRVNESDTDFTTLETAALARTSLDIMILTGPAATTGNRGFRFDAKFSKFFGENQALDQLLWRSCTLKPCVNTNPPKSVVVTAGAPVYTSLSI